MTVISLSKHNIFSPIKICISLFLCLKFCISTQSVYAQEISPENITNQVEQHLAELFPSLNNIEITPTKIPDVYQFWIGTKLNYVQYKEGHIFLGELFDTNRKVSLAREAEQKRVSEIIANIDEKDLIIYPAENEKHSISIFTDVKCHYCRKIHTDIPQLNKAGISVQYIAFPAFSQDINEHISVWCAENRHLAMDLAKKGTSIPKINCENSIQESLKLGFDLGFRATPNIVYGNGQIAVGYRSPQQIIEHLAKK